MKKIILIYPFGEFDISSNIHQLPYGMFSLLNYLNYKGFKTKIIDTRFLIKDKKYLDAIKREINSTDLFGISVLTGNVKSSLEISDFIKTNDSDKKIIWGGVHPSLFPKQTCLDESIDYVCQGEGEELIEELITGTPLKKIDGLVYKKNRKIKINQERKPLDVNKLPEFDWNLINVKRYIQSLGFSHSVKKSLFIQASRGCPHRCTFCVNRILKCYNHWRPRKIDHIINEIKKIVSKYNIKWIKFIDENFFVDKKRAINICKRFIDEKFDFKWNANIRADYFKKSFLSDENLKIAIKSGLKEVDIGAESGSNRILKKLKKDITREQLINSAKRCNSFNITPVYSFMIGLPGEKRKDIIQTVSVMKQINKNCKEAVFLGPHIYRPYPGGELYEEIKRLGFKEPNNLREWPKIVEKSEKEALSVGDSTGYTTYEHLNWIKDPKLVKRVITYAAYAAQNPIVLIKRGRYLTAGISLISKFRFKTNFWALPYEQKIFSTIMNKLKSNKDK